jgi:hypothetical protein
MRALTFLLTTSVLLPTCLTASGFAGTWKRDNTKGSLSPVPTLVIEPRDGGWNMKWSMGASEQVVFDGKDHPAPPRQVFDASSFKRVDRTKVVQTGKRAGVVAGTNTWIVSQDGRELQQIADGKYQNGQRYHNEVFWTRSGSGAGDDPFIGTWQSDPKRSNIGVPVTYTISDVENGIQLKSSFGLTYTAKFDGKPYPTSGVQSPGTVSLEQVDPQTIRTVFKRADGTVNRVSTLSVSGDILTETTELREPNAETIRAVSVFDKQ